MGMFFGCMMIMLGLSGMGAGIGNGLRDLGDSIKTAHGYVERCEGTWYRQDCQWVKA